MVRFLSGFWPRFVLGAFIVVNLVVLLSRKNASVPAPAAGDTASSLSTAGALTADPVTVKKDWWAVPVVVASHTNSSSEAPETGECNYPDAKVPEQELVDLTIVMATRVDEYGGEESFARMQQTLDTLEFYCAKHGKKFDLELVIVEYNPTPNNKRLIEVIRLPKSVTFTRIIRVDAEVHRRFCRSKNDYWRRIVPVVEFVAKNIGIRRARGRYILPMAMDTILSASFWKFLSEGGLASLDPKKLYRMFRVDVGVGIPKSMPRDEVESFLEKNVRIVWGTGQPDNNSVQGRVADAVAFMNETVRRVRHLQLRFQQACGDFQLMHRDTWFKLRGYFEATSYGHFDTVMLLIAEHGGVQFDILEPPLLLYHQHHSSGGFAKRVGSYVETSYSHFFSKTDLATKCAHDAWLCRSQRGNPNNCFWGHAREKFPEEVFHFGAKLDVPSINRKHWIWPL